MKAISGSVIVTSYRPKADGSFSITLSTPEMGEAEKMEWMRYHNKNAKILIQPGDEEPSELVTMKNPTEGKTYSQRIKARCYVLWEAEFDGVAVDERTPFDVYYAQKMEKVLDWFSTRIDDAKG